MLARSLILVLLVSACSTGRGRIPPRDGGPGDSGIHVRCDNDTDTDGDTILDDYENAWGAPEHPGDSDGDGTPNASDSDSDNDGLSDRDEAGPGGCNPRNSDDDTIPDFLDNDSDNDGLSDREETTVYFTDPLDDDTDRDGFSDLAEAAVGTDPNSASSRIPPETFYVVLPFEGEMVERDLVFGTSVRKADVFFMLDGTGSMDGERSRLVSSLSTIVPQLAMSIRDVGVGFGGFAGFGGPAGGTCTSIFGIESCPDGPEGDEPFRLDQVITTNIAEMQAGVSRLHTDYGGANWASSNEALYLAATGEGFQPWLGPQSCPGIPDEMGRRYGYPCFRPGSLPIMVVMTDTSSKNGPLTSGVSGGTYDPAGFTMSPRGPHTYTETLAALNGIGARVIGILSG
ncbi:MAG: hypothetical protein IT378_05365, partial [Sandaracinaceae bacterium]|nr:hypothetical protein [Sandaracinaceae bacterium]